VDLESQGWQRLGRASGYDEGKITSASMLDQYDRPVEIAVTRTSAGLDVIVDRCPHQGVAFTARGCINRYNQLVCKWHDWTFNLANGTDTSARGITLQTVESQVHEGHVWVRPDPNVFY